MQVLDRDPGSWVIATPEQMADVQDVLTDDKHDELFLYPTSWGLTGINHLPDWAPKQASADRAAASVDGSANCRYVHGSWEHIFHPGRAANVVRLVYDREQEELVAMQIRHRGAWVTAKQEEISDVEDSLKNANEDALQHPEPWGLKSTEDRPLWCQVGQRSAERQRA